MLVESPFYVMRELAGRQEAVDIAQAMASLDRSTPPRRIRVNVLRMLTVAAHMLSWAAFFVVVFWPYGYSSMSQLTYPDGETFGVIMGHSPGPFRRYLGLGEISLLLIPTVLTAFAVWLVWWRDVLSGRAKLAMWGLATLCLAFCSVPIWFVKEADISFIGVFNLPAAAALVVSALFVSINRQAPDGSGIED